MEDFPTKSEVQGGRRKRKNPHAEKLRDRRFHQRIKRNKRREKREDAELSDYSSEFMDGDIGDTAE